jgi:murein DD-endopeptidase MepM/ murein hydrolase activator NlpD
MSWILPFRDSAITGHYGTLSDYRRSKGMQPHSGTDWAAKTGTLIPAIASGTVKLIQWSRILGWVVVQSAMDNKGNVWYLGYCHLTCSQHGDKCKGDHESPLTKTKVGDKVNVGQKYLRVGNTGSATTGSHLHATASKTVKGVFGATSSKVDLYKLILANAERPEKKQTNAQTKTVVEKVKPQNKQPIAQKPEVVFACPHCKKELK